MIGESLAILAGLCAAAASVCAKLAFSPEVINPTCLAVIGWVQDAESYCSWITFAMQLVFFLLIFAFNGLMWTLFVTSLQKSPSSLHATVTNTVSNFFFSAISGWLLFGETLRLLWWIGASFIVMGVVLINHSQPDEQKKKLT